MVIAPSHKEAAFLGTQKLAHGVIRIIRLYAALPKTTEAQVLG